MTEWTAPLEVRAAGRRLTGPALVYGEVASDRAERFLAGSMVSAADPLELRLQHDPEMVVATTDDRLDIADTPAELRAGAELVPGAVLDLVERRALRGLSVGFHALDEHRDAQGIRVVAAYHLDHIGLVDIGSYASSTVELRARMGRTLSAGIPTGKRLACECCGPNAEFAELAGEMAQAIDDAVKRAFDEIAAGNDIIAAYGRYDRPLASARNGSLRTEVDGDDVRVEIDLPDSEAGRAVVAAQESAGLVVRPYIDEAHVNRYEMPDGTVRYSPKPGEPPIRAFIASSTDRRAGWPDPVIRPTPGLETRASGLAVPRRRKALLWL